MVWDSAPPSDQLAKVYCVPGAVWGDDVAIVCVLPAGNDNTCEALYETPSTVYVAPLGLVPNVTATPVPLTVTEAAFEVEGLYEPSPEYEAWRESGPEGRLLVE